MNLGPVLWSWKMGGSQDIKLVGSSCKTSDMFYKKKPWLGFDTKIQRNTILVCIFK